MHDQNMHRHQIIIIMIVGIWHIIIHLYVWKIGSSWFKKTYGGRSSLAMYLMCGKVGRGGWDAYSAKQTVNAYTISFSLPSDRWHFSLGSTRELRRARYTRMWYVRLKASFFSSDTISFSCNEVNRPSGHSILFHALSVCCFFFLSFRLFCNFLFCFFAFLFNWSVRMWRDGIITVCNSFVPMICRDTNLFCFFESVWHISQIIIHNENDQ